MSLLRPVQRACDVVCHAWNCTFVSIYFHYITNCTCVANSTYVAVQLNNFIFLKIWRKYCKEMCLEKLRNQHVDSC